MKIASNPIQAAYINGQSGIEDFFKYPIRPDWNQLCRNVLDSYKNRDFLDILKIQNSHIEDPVLQRNLQLLILPNTVILITGQQLGLFVSPLYTLYKTLTTILLSRKLNKEYNDYNFIPVFWLEGEDHDFDEINHAQYYDQNGSIFRVEHPEEEGKFGWSISKRQLLNQIGDILQTIQNSFQETEFTEPLFQRLRQFYQENKFWTKAFSDLLRDIFRGTGLLLYNPADAQVKKLSAEFFINLAIKNKELTNAFGNQTQKLTKSGFELQVPFDVGKSYIFISEGDGPRQHLLKTESGEYYFKGENSKLSEDTILAKAKSNPEWFSSTVLTRPIWQSWMLPVVSYIAGPAEIAYWAQLKPAFEALNVEMPHLTPRISITLLEPKIQRLLKKYEINLDEIIIDKDEFVREQIKRLESSNLENDFSAIRKKLKENEELIQNSVLSIDPTLKDLVTKTFDNASTTISKLENRILKRLEEKNVLVVRHLEEIHTAIFPDNQIQERYIGSLYFLNKYGPGLPEKIASQVDPVKYTHQIAEL
jgi:bacillithiol biosynthesis cysteine-adding enzyme BshC